MTDEEMRVAIAEAWGFEPGTINTNSWLGYCTALHAETLYQLGCDVGDSDEKPDHILAKVPSFLTNLDAMHETEKTLNSKQAWNFARMLSEIVEKESSFGHHWYRLCHATARQRALAFLATLP